MNFIFIKFKEKASDYKVIFWVYIVVGAAAGAVKYFLPKDHYTYYENYVIFKNSFLHLISYKNIYGPFLSEQWDLFKYSPSFAVFMGLFAFFPDLIGLVLWSILNAAMVYFAIRSLPVLNKKIKVSILWFIFIELLTSIQSAQSNGLMAGLLILTFTFLEKRNYFLAACMLLCSVYIKIFGVLAVILFLFYPDKMRSFLYLLGWTVFLFFIPLLFISPQQLFLLYEKWGILLQSDHTASYGMSVMAAIHVYFGIEINKLLVIGIGGILLCLPLLRFSAYKNLHFRMLFLCAILIWVIIFNHKAESPTFIIAVCGVAIWYFTEVKNYLNLTLLLLTLVLTCLSPTDLFPAYLRRNFTDVYVLKMLPCFLVWLKILYELLTGQFDTEKTYTYPLPQSS